MPGFKRVYTLTLVWSETLACSCKLVTFRFISIGMVTKNCFPVCEKPGRFCFLLSYV